MTAALLALSLWQTPLDPAALLRGPAETVGPAGIPVGHRAVSLGENTTQTFLALMGASGGGEGDEAARLLIEAIDVTFVSPDEFAALLAGRVPRIKGYALDFKTLSLTSSSERPEPLFRAVFIEGGRVAVWSPRPEITREALVAAYPNVAVDSRLPALTIRLKAVHSATMMYQADNGGMFPKPGVAAKAIAPYLKDPRATAGLYLNPLLAGGKNEGVMGNLPLWAEPKAGPEGRRGVVTLDGKILFITEAKWSREFAPFFTKTPTNGPGRAVG